MPFCLNNGINHRYRSGAGRLLLLVLLLLAQMALASKESAAGCSQFSGQATINEVHDQSVIDYYVEVKIINTNIPKVVYDNWTVTICNEGGVCGGPYALGSDDQSNFPWIVIGKMPASDTVDPIGNPNLIDIRNGTDVILKDAAGNTIDYLSINGLLTQQDATCTPAFAWQVDVPNNTMTVNREPDGTGNWSFAPGSSDETTPGSTNDTTPDGLPPPPLSIFNAITTAGQPAAFTLTLGATTNYAITVDYQTIDDTAIAGTDYYAVTNGQLTIPAGTPAGSTFAISINTFSTSAGNVRFFLYLYNQVNVSLVNHYAIGQILGINHYSISHSGTAINCQAEPVTISAHNASHAVITTHTGPVNLSTNTGHGDWSVITGTPANLLNSGGGVATYTFAAGNNGVVVLGLKNNFVESVNINVTNGTATETTGAALPADDPLLNFAAAGFNFLGATVADNIATQIGGKSSSQAPGNQLLELQAIRTSDKTGACEAALQGLNTIDLAFECRDPTTCTANQLAISGIAIAGNNNGAVASYTGVPLDFGDATDSTATFTLNYPEVGRLRLHARYNIPLGSGSPSGTLMLATSNEFVVRPFGFQINAAGNPAVSGPGGAVYTSAGTPFNTTVRAVLWQAGDDTDLDGIPDGHNDTNPANNVELATNLAALNFGREVAPETVSLSAQLLLPAPTLPLTANNPGLAGTTTVSGFTNGTATSAVRFDEVGSIEINAASSGAGYLGAGVAQGRSGVVGRFRPHHLRVVVAPDPPTLADACLSGSFTYLGEPFTFTAAPVVTITAENQGNTTTRNYDCGGFWRLPEPYALAYTYADGTGAGPTLTPAGGSGSPAITVPSATTDCTGSISLTLNDNFNYSRPPLTSPISPFSAKINLAANAAQFTDSDGVCFDTGPGCQGLTRNGITGATLRLGQTLTSNAYGPETANIAEPLLLPVTLQYYDNTAHWVTNSADNCTQFSYLITPDGSITVAGSPVSPVTTVGGRGDLRLWPTADPAPAGGQVLIDYTLPTWLGPNAQAEAFFGIYRGNDRIINWRELVR